MLLNITNMTNDNNIMMCGMLSSLCIFGLYYVNNKFDFNLFEDKKLNLNFDSEDDDKNTCKKCAIMNLAAPGELDWSNVPIKERIELMTKSCDRMYRKLKYIK